MALRPSRLLAAALLAVHAAGALGLWVALPGAWASVGAPALLALGAAAAWNVALLRGRRAPRSIEISHDAALVVEFADGSRRSAARDTWRYVGPWGVGLPLEGRPRRRILLAPDMLPEPSHRLVRLWALWNRLPGSGDDARARADSGRVAG